MDYEPKPSSDTLDQGNMLDDEEIQKIVELYEEILKQRTHGPQLEGLEGHNLAEALRTEPGNVLLLDIVNEQGEITGKWPLFIPVVHHQDYSKVFFESHYPERNSYYFSLPPDDGIESLTDSPDNLEAATQFLRERSAIIAYDYLEGEESEALIPALIERMLADSDATVEDITPDSKAWGQEFGKPLSVHYEGVARLINPPERPASSVSEAVARLIRRGEVEHLPENGETLLIPEDLNANDEEILRRLWEVYSGQFDVLIEDHPILGKQPHAEFKSMLLDDATVNVGFMVDGEASGLVYPVNEIEKCVWLNSEYYEKFKDGWVAHIPGIVVAKDKARQGAEYAPKMMDLVLKIVAEMGQDFVITFACSNVSSTYIPKMVRRAVGQSSQFDFDEDGLQESARYGYRILEVS